MPLVALTGQHGLALVAIIVARDSPAAEGASGPLAGMLGVGGRAAGASPVPVPVPVVGAWDTADAGDVITLVPVLVSALVPERHDGRPRRGSSSYRWDRSRRLV